MVRLVWFPGYMDWERRKYTWKYEGKCGRSRSEVICTMCIPSSRMLLLSSPGCGDANFVSVTNAAINVKPHPPSTGSR